MDDVLIGGLKDLGGRWQTFRGASTDVNEVEFQNTTTVPALLCLPPR